MFIRSTIASIILLCGNCVVGIGRRGRGNSWLFVCCCWWCGCGGGGGSGGSVCVSMRDWVYTPCMCVRERES